MINLNLALALIFLALTPPALVAAWLWQRLRDHQAITEILQEHLAAEQRYNRDLVNANYELAVLNEELFVALDHHSRPLAQRWGCVASTN